MAIQEGGTFSPDNRIVSPGVFTRENDLSGVASGVADIGGVVVAPFAKGPAFSPMSFTDVNVLQNSFGVPDGEFYGPYTAAEYLQERGLVTVCRVGGLTGYEQKYPFGIWAIKGTYSRASSAGSLNSGSSFIYFSGSAVNQFSESIAWTAPTSKSMAISLPSLTVTFNSGVADDATLSPIANSGSILYAGSTVTLGIATLINAIANISQSQFSASIANGTFSASITNPTILTFPSGSAPWTSVTLISGSMNINLGTCGFPIVQLAGVLSGSFGKYTGFVSNGSASFDPCVLPNGAWTTQSNADVKLLTVLADTQAGGIQNLIAPGFNGSSLSLTTPIGTGIAAVSDIPLDFSLVLKNSNSTTAYGTYQFSLDSNSPKYITNVFGTAATAGNPANQVVGQKIEAAYLYKIYEDAIADIVSQKTSWAIFGGALPTGSYTGEPMNFTDANSFNVVNGDSAFSVTNAITPWIVSQKIAPWQSGSSTPTRFELFRILTLADGTYTNTTFKVEVSNVKLAGTVAGSDWGTFTLTLRSFSDTDKRPIVIEQYNNLSLDPNSANFIARRVGDRYNYINFAGKVIEFGTYSNNSKNIRIEMSQNNYPISAIPYGFEAYAVPTNGSLGFFTPRMKYTKASVYGLAPGKYPSGITFDDAPTGADAELFSLYPHLSSGAGAASDNKQYLAPLPTFSSNGGTYVSVGRNVTFALDDDYELYSVGTGSFLSGSNAIPTVYDVVNESTYIKMRRFVFGFQSGFDGQSPAIDINVGGDISPGNTQGLDCTNVSSAGSVAYNQAISALGNPDEYDINLIVVPGILHQYHPYVTNLVVDMCEKRADCFYIMDLYADSGNPAVGQIDQVVSYAAEYDTNYAAAYYPWIKILDTFNNKIVTVPPSVVLPSVYASSDKVAAEWYAPAGLNRGGIPIATQVTDRTTHDERNTLYEGKVNPIAAFPSSGIVVWGQKTLQNADSALNRINVRRLLINIKKYFASTSKYLVFEQNVAATRNKFLSIVNPYLESVQQRAGLYAFYVKMDDSNNTPDIIDQNILYGQIYLKPTKTAEFIVLDFNILPTGAQFPNA